MNTKEFIQSLLFVIAMLCLGGWALFYDARPLAIVGGLAAMILAGTMITDILE